ncbi:hypothetical protein F5X99DRAFT_425649 [Biscogniauxia marginata]|nr:hypothetical protein F5X99DRAFT_425649 [Biscogniauxia marginata]
MASANGNTPMNAIQGSQANAITHQQRRYVIQNVFSGLDENYHDLMLHASWVLGSPTVYRQRPFEPNFSSIRAKVMLREGASTLEKIASATEIEMLQQFAIHYHPAIQQWQEEMKGDLIGEALKLGGPIKEKVLEDANNLGAGAATAAAAFGVNTGAGGTGAQTGSTISNPPATPTRPRTPKAHRRQTSVTRAPETTPSTLPSTPLASRSSRHHMSLRALPETPSRPRTLRPRSRRSSQGSAQQSATASIQRGTRGRLGRYPIRTPTKSKARGPSFHQDN